jgi:hypothetical protein
VARHAVGLTVSEMNEVIPLLRLILIASALFLSVVAYAQALQAGARPASPTNGPILPPPEARIEAGLAYLRAALVPAPAQALPWGRLADVLRAQARERDAKIHFRQSAQETDGKFVQNDVNPSLIDEIVTKRQRMIDETGDLAKLLAALKLLYATLTDQHKIIADEMIRPGPGGPHAFGPPGRE